MNKNVSLLISLGLVVIGLILLLSGKPWLLMVFAILALPFAWYGDN